MGVILSVDDASATVVRKKKRGVGGSRSVGFPGSDRWAQFGKEGEREDTHTHTHLRWLHVLCVCVYIWVCVSVFGWVGQTWRFFGTGSTPTPSVVCLWEGLRWGGLGSSVRSLVRRDNVDSSSNILWLHQSVVAIIIFGNLFFSLLSSITLILSRKS